MPSAQRKAANPSSKESEAKAELASSGPIRASWKAGLLGLILAVLVPYALHQAWPWKAASFQLRPFDAPLVKESLLFSHDYQESLFWGTYRPGMYCGIRSRQPQSLVAGVMWAAPTPQAWSTIRHHARHEDKLQVFGWQRHDLRSYGEQHVIDGDLGVTTTFSKLSGGPGYGGDWALRVNVSARTPERASKGATLYFYLGEEAINAEGVAINGSPVFTPLTSAPSITNLTRGRGAVLAEGVSSRVERWALTARAWLQKRTEASVALVAMPVRDFYNMHELAKEAIAINYRKLAQEGRTQDFKFDMESFSQDDANSLLLQVQALPPFSVDFAFTAGLPTSDDEAQKHRQTRAKELVGSSFTQRAAASASAFDTRLSEVAGVNMTGRVQQVVQTAVSEVLGSMGSFYGSSIVHMPGTEAEPVLRETVPAALFTAVPSRAFFPRGFLWDEGFHQLLVQQWDLQASCDALAHWLDLINANGWIPREEILGREARSRVPEEFLAQLPEAANPPTLFLPLLALAQALQEPPAGVGSSTATSAAAAALRRQVQVIPREHWLDFLRRAWPRLLLWFRWFDQLQAGPLPGSYRWRGRVSNSDRELNPKTLASGLDDFPRASHPTDDERHLDIRCWMAFAAQALALIGESIGAPDAEIAEVRKKHAQLVDFELLKAQHWDSETQSFLDWGLHTEDVVLRKFYEAGKPSEYEVRRAEVGKAPKHQYVPHFGYNSLFPLALRLIPPDSPEFAAQLQKLRAPDLLWTAFGLRSLAKNSTLYRKFNTEHDPPYWRGPVWININFLVLRSLLGCFRDGGPHAEQCSKLYVDLRRNLLQNVIRQFHDGRDGSYIWEHYHDDGGQGLGTHPFGWSSALSALIALERY